MAPWKAFFSFLQSHRRKITIFALVGTALYGAYRLRKAYSKLELQLDSSGTETGISPIHRKFETCQRTITLTVYAFLALLKSRLWELTQVEDTVRQLKSSEAHVEHKKRELWEKLKVSTFTRIICGAYALPLLFVVVTVKVSLLGRYLTDELRVPFQEVASSGLTNDDWSKLFEEIREHQSNSIDRTTQQAYLDATWTCFDRFMVLLVGKVKESVEEILERTSITQSVDMEFWDSTIASIRENMEKARTDVDSLYSFSMVPKLVAEQELHIIKSGNLEAENVNKDSLLVLSNETADIIEGDDFCEVLMEVVEIVFEMIRKQISSAMQNNTQITVAQLLPKLQSVVAHVFADSTSNSYIQAISELDCVENFAAVIFLSGEKHEPSEN